jgi:MFS family permease
VPDGARGEAMGWHGSSLTVGLAVGAPLAGWAIDHGSSAWGFVAVGAAGALVTLALLPMRRRLAGAEAQPAEAGPTANPVAGAKASPTAGPTAGSTAGTEVRVEV